MNLKESKEEHIVQFGGEKGRNYIIIISKIKEK